MGKRHVSYGFGCFRELIKGCKLFILCNPHNPGGVVWTEAELRAIADICYDEKVLVFSDEIHADLTLPPHTHRPFATVSEKARMNSVTFMSPSKAFNMPGLSASHALILMKICVNVSVSIWMPVSWIWDMSLLFFLLRLLIVMVRNGLTNVWHIYKEI